MTHPAQPELALFAGGDVTLWRRLRIREHLRTCDGCRAECEQLGEVLLEARGLQAELPPNLRWERLAAEMTANIRLGLEAGECVGPARAGRPRGSWRAAAVMASLCLLLAAAWWLNPPLKMRQGLLNSQVTIRNTAAGLEVKENGNALVLLHAQQDNSQQPIIVSAPGVLRARYVDAETGQITINDVYAQ